MWKDLRVFVIPLTLALGIVIGLVAGAAYLNRPKYQKPTGQRADSGNTKGYEKPLAEVTNEHDMEVSDLKAQWVMAWGSIVGSLLLAGTLVYSVCSTRAALRLTTESVDSFVETERGMLRFMDGETQWVNNQLRCCFTIQNIGRGLATIDSISVAYQLLDHPLQDVDFSIPYTDLLVGRQEMPSGDVLTVGTYQVENRGRDRTENIMGTNNIVPMDIALALSPSFNRPLCARYRVVYRTAFNATHELVEALVYPRPDVFAFHGGVFSDRRIRGRRTEG